MAEVATQQKQQVLPFRLEGDSVIWTVAILLMLFSILVVYSATGSLAFNKADGDTELYLFRHTGYIVLALVAMYFCHKLDYIYFSKLSRYALLISVPLLLLTWKYGNSVNEASRWLTVPFINKSFQPSDLAKLALITNLASMLSKRQLSIHEFQRAIVPVLIWCGIICGLIGLTNWSSASLLFLTCGLMLFIGRVPAKYLGIMLLIGMCSGVFAFSFGQRGQTVSSRVEAYFTDTDVPYQEEQSMIAVASGGVTGRGVGQSIQRNFLPYPYSDFIFAIILEEYGFLGGVGVIAMYLILLYRGLLIVTKSHRAYGGLLASGIIFMLVVQAFVNMGVVLGLLPITGLPLPLISMGGTSLLFTGIALGIVLSVSRADNMLEGALSQRDNRKKQRNRTNQFQPRANSTTN